MLKIQEFKGLTDSETKRLYEAPALIAVLIAAADSKIEAQETEWAKKVIGYRQETGVEALFNYYEIADTYFDEALQAALDGEKGNQERILSLENELAELNPILAKIDGLFAAELVKNWRSFAKQVAKSAGGFLGFGSISDQEARLMNLSMIDLSE
ncbi:MAG: hypothetical protein AB8G11_13645 [Saprospiraceae bacterium]